VLADNVLSVHLRAAKMNVDDRYTYLNNWVLPSGATRPRLNGMFQTTDSNSAEDSLPRRLICPALELIDIAAESGRLKELRHRAESLTHDELQRSTLLLLLALRTADAEQSDVQLARLAELFHRNKTLDDDAAWCYLLADLKGSQSIKLRQAVLELLNTIDVSRFGNAAPNTNLRWGDYISAVARVQHESIWHGTAAKDWLPVTILSSRFNADEVPPARWVCDESGLHDHSGSKQHFLYYRIPLRGNFDVSGETSQFYLRDIAILFAGQYVLPRGKVLRIGDVVSEQKKAGLDPIPVDAWARFRIEVRNRICSTWFNGRMVHQRELPEDHDPWRAIRSGSRMLGTLRNLQIVGDPSVPASVNMISSDAMTDWFSYFGDKIGTQTEWPTWRIIDNGKDRLLAGARRKVIDGTSAESLIRYSRPVPENGMIEYEFRDVPDSLLVHPAIGNWAFLLHEDGVKTSSNHKPTLRTQWHGP
jgi:hypothetical protein